ncbi:MAG TPA: 5-oxoprolinase subunit PxpB [Longimicrobiales bacterium]
MRIEPLGDGGALVRFGDRIDEAAERLVRAACAVLDADPVPGSIELVPAFTSVAVFYDPARVGTATPYARVAAALEQRLAGLGVTDAPPGRMLEIPVRYGGEAGPDLEAVAQHAGLDAQEVVRLHSAGDYLVHMVGFAPGFPYLGGLDERLHCPRRAVPRTLVPAGSVGIGGSQTGVYPLESPGGWQIIGRTPLALFDPAREPAALLRPGDRVRFLPLEDA